MEPVHVAIGTAISAEGNSRYPAGEKHGAMLFVRALDQEDAIKKMDRAMNEGYWMLSIEKMGTIAEPAHKPDATDPIEVAINTALEDGCGVVIYSDIEE